VKLYVQVTVSGLIMPARAPAPKRSSVARARVWARTKRFMGVGPFLSVVMTTLTQHGRAISGVLREVVPGDSRREGRKAPPVPDEEGCPGPDRLPCLTGGVVYGDVRCMSIAGSPPAAADPAPGSDRKSGVTEDRLNRNFPDGARGNSATTSTSAAVRSPRYC